MAMAGRTHPALGAEGPPNGGQGGGILLPQGACPAGMHPPFLFCLAKRETGRARSKEKGTWTRSGAVALRADGGRREMVPAGLRWLPDGRGGVRYRLERGFPRRGCALGRGAKLYLISLFFRAFRFATRCPGGRRGLCFRADEGIGPYAGVGTPARADTQVSPYGWAGPRFSVGANAHIRPLHQFPRGTASGSEKRSRDNAITTPTTSAPSATGRQSQKLQKMIACPKAGQNRRLHRSADPRRAEARTRRSASKRSFLLDRARPVSLLARPKGAPAAPRAVGRGGARERAQFSPQAETELSGLCDDDNGGCIPLDQPPAGAESPVAAGRRPIPCYPRTSLRPSR